MRLRAGIIATLMTALPALAGEIALSDSCPPSFSELADGTCELVTLYQFYTSPPGHGGVQAHLDPPAQRYTAQEIDLGRYLFFDPILSASGDMSCASCHQPDQGFSDGLPRGIGQVELDRATPTLWNIAFADKLMWDGRAKTLEDQAVLPLVNANEMANTPEGVEAALNAEPAYVALFDQVFEDRPTVAHLARALAAFQSSLISLNSRYDRYAHGDPAALTDQEIAGLNVFRGFVARCSQCHIPPLFTDHELAVVGAPADDAGQADAGAGALHPDDPFLQGAFKTPTLRNVAVSAPYFQSGQFRTLDEVVEFYNDTRGHAAAAGLEVRPHWHIHMTRGPELSQQSMDDIVAFLGALTDETLTPEIPTVLPGGRSPLTGRPGQ